MDYEQRIDEVLEDWLRCTQVCDLKVPERTKNYGLERVDEYMRILPGADYVLTQTLNYIFSNGLTTGSINEDEVLDSFLYKVNGRGTTNLHELRNTIGMAITHGGSGLRWLNGNVYQYKWGTYKVITYKSNGIEMVLGYLVSEDGGKVPVFDFDPEKYEEYDDFLREIRERHLILLSPDEFCNIRNDTSAPYGSSPLLADVERLDLMIAVYERLNYDIRYDGPGRIVIRPKDGYVSGADDISASTVMSGALAGADKQVEIIKAEASRVAKQMKESSSDSVIVLSNAFDEKITHLERVTKATEFFNWLKNDTLILAQDFGMSPSLMELGGVSGNVSMTSIIDTAILHSIVPLRERFAVQFSPFLARHMDVTKVFFNLYELQQQEDENTMRTKIVNIMSLLNSMRDEQDNIRPEALELFRDFGNMLSENIHNENGVVEEL